MFSAPKNQGRASAGILVIGQSCDRKAKCSVTDVAWHPRAQDQEHPGFVATVSELDTESPNERTRRASVVSTTREALDTLPTSTVTFFVRL
jgi:hypothetical protein